MKNMRKTYGKEKAEKVFYASANKGKIKGVHAEDIEKYATEDEKLFLEGLEDFRGGDTAITGEDEDDMDYVAQEQNPEGMKSLRRLKLQKKLGGSHGFKHFTQPFDKHGNPRKYLEILLALDAAPDGLSKLEIYNDVLGRDYTPYQAKGQDTAGMWVLLKQEGLYETRKDPKTGKLRLFTGPRWNEYKKKILGLEITPADEGEDAVRGEF